AMGMPFVELDPHLIHADAMTLIAEPLSRAQQVLAYDLGDPVKGFGPHGAGRDVEVAVLDLGSLAHLHDLERTHRILPRLTSEASMRRGLLHYQKHLREKFGAMLSNGEQLAQALV